MDNQNLTPGSSSDKNTEKVKSNNNNCLIFKNIRTSFEYLEILSNDKQFIKVIFRNPEEINSKNSDFNEIIHNNINQFKEITLIFDFQRLSLELETDELVKIIKKFFDNLEFNQKLSLIIKNSYINPEKKLNPIRFPTKLILNKLEIHDEIYSLSTRLGELLPDIEVNELILKKFKFNSKSQISNFFQFILRSGCKMLTLEDIFVELIIKNDENDEDYKDLDIYFTYVDGVITIDNNYTPITSLTMRDCPLFAIIGNMFTYQEENEQLEIIKRDIDIDETSLINPFIITRFKIINGKFETCFDLDSFKLKLEEKEDKNNYDYIDYLDYIFNILIDFTRDDQKIVKQKLTLWEEDEDGLREIDRKRLHKLTFKNFDTSKLEYITGDDMTFIEEKNWILNEEEKKKKERWEKLEKDLEAFCKEKNKILSNVKELVFDNCSNFFIKWVIFFIKGENKEVISYNTDFDLLKIKKCAKEYVNLDKILTMKIDKLILFDNPLIIGNTFPNEDHPHLEVIENNLGSIANLTIKINTLDGYGKHYNLNTYKTYEILEELILNKNFNKNITFELYSLSNFMTFLAYKTYLENQNYYNNPNEEEDGLDEINNDKIIIGIDQNENEQKDEMIHLPKLMIFSSKRFRDDLYYKSFNIQALEKSKITLKTLTIKKQTENFDNQNYLLKKTKDNNKNYTENNLLKKIDFGSDGFFIERDYKFFFSENNIDTVELRNVIFSNYKDNNLKDKEGETITNLISNNELEENSIKVNEYKETHFPNYRIDYKTLNGILFKNYLFEDVGIMFTYYMYRIDDPKSGKNPVTPDTFEKKNTLMEYFKKFKELFEFFSKNIQKLTIIINNIKELKEFCCTLGILKVLLNKQPSDETLIFGGKEIKIKLPKKSDIEYEIGGYFLKEKNTEEKNCYSEINYYYTSKEEEIMIKNKKIEFEINNKYYIIYIEYDFDIFKEIA